MQFLPIPGFTAYEINAEGVVRNIKTQKIKAIKTDNPAQVQIKNDAGIERRIFFAEVAESVHAEPIAEPSANSKLLISEKVPPVPKNTTLEPAAVASSEHLSTGQKVYYLKNINGLLLTEIAPMVGLSKDACHGHNFRIINNPKKLAAFHEAVKTL